MTFAPPHHHGSRPGFTLIELMIVAVIVGILVGVAIPKYTMVRERAARRAMISDLRNLAGAQESYFSTEATYTTSTDALGFAGSSDVTLDIVEATPTGWSARATRAGFSGDCTLAVGLAAPLNPDATQGQIACIE